MTNQTRTEPLDLERLVELEQADGEEAERNAKQVKRYPRTVFVDTSARYEYEAALRNAAPSLIAEAREAARLRTAAQALVDAWPRTETPYWAQRTARALDDLRAALVKP